MFMHPLDYVFFRQLCTSDNQSVFTGLCQVTSSFVGGHICFPSANNCQTMAIIWLRAILLFVELCNSVISSTSERQWEKWLSNAMFQTFQLLEDSSLVFLAFLWLLLDDGADARFITFWLSEWPESVVPKVRNCKNIVIVIYLQLNQIIVIRRMF